jgi:hypothetical protein
VKEADTKCERGKQFADHGSLLTLNILFHLKKAPWPERAPKQEDLMRVVPFYSTFAAILLIDFKCGILLFLIDFGGYRVLISP